MIILANSYVRYVIAYVIDLVAVNGFSWWKLFRI